MRHEIRSELAATVIEVLACEGESLRDGDTIVLLESMKMEIPVVIESESILLRLNVEVGQAVKSGDVMAVIDDRCGTER